MSVSIQQIIAKKHNQKWSNYPKIKEAIEQAYKNQENWGEVELPNPWYWRHNFFGNHIILFYQCADEKKGRRITVRII